MAVLQNKWTEQERKKKPEPKRKERPVLGVSGNMHKTLRGVRK